MLKQKNNWLSIFVLSYADKPLKLSAWDDIIASFDKKKYKMGRSALYTEKISVKENKDGTYFINSGKWKNRLVTVKKEYLQSYKVNIKKVNSAPFTIKEIGEMRADFRQYLRMLPIKYDYIGIDYYPFKDSFGVDKGFPKNPPIDNYGFLILASISALGALAYAQKK